MGKAGNSFQKAAVGEDLARVLPNDGIPWYKKRHIIILNFYAISMCFLAAANGYDGSMMNGLLALPQWSAFMDHPTGTWLGFINSVQALSSFVTYPIIAYFANRWGRKRGIFIGFFFLFLGALLQVFAHNDIAFILGRFFLGQPSAWWSGLAPLLITELAYPTHRAFLTALFNCGWYIGSTLAAWIGIPIIVLPAAILIPESPRFLVSQGKITEARSILTKYYGGGDTNSTLVEFEMAEIEAALDCDLTASKSSSWKELISTKGNRHLLQTIGITSVEQQTLISGCMQVWNLFISVGAAASVDYIGRRTLFLISAIGMFFSFAIVAGLSGGFAATGTPSIGTAVVPFLFIFYGFYDIAFTPIGICYIAEIWQYHLRARGLALGQMATYVAIFFNVFINPIALEAIAWKYYHVYVFILAIIALTRFTYPETKGHTLEEMKVVFDGDQPLNVSSGIKGQSSDKAEDAVHEEMA